MCISRLICVLSLDCITKVYKKSYKYKSPQEDLPQILQVARCKVLWL